MANFKIQAYNREMTELISEYSKEFERTEDALIEAFDKADSADIAGAYVWHEFSNESNPD